MAYGRDIVIHLADAYIAEDDVRQSLEKFVTVQSLTASPSDAATLHASLLTAKHVDHLLNVLSGKLLVGGRFCSFERPPEEDSDEDEDETLVEDPHVAFHDAFLTPKKSTNMTPMSTPIAIPVTMDQSSSVFLTPPHSLSSSTLDGEATPPRDQRSSSDLVLASISSTSTATTIPIGLHPEITVVDPSPFRPETRAPRRRVAELAEIFDRVATADATADASLTRLFDDADCGGERFLPLPPPYHLLPNTPYFRNAPIAPPPLAAPLPPPPAQRIINRYISSMQVKDNIDELEIQSIMCFNFNRTIGYCPYTIPEKDPLELRHPDEIEDTIDEDWSIWEASETHGLFAAPTTAHHERTRLTY